MYPAWNKVDTNISVPVGDTVFLSSTKLSTIVFSFEKMVLFCRYYSTGDIREKPLKCETNDRISHYVLSVTLFYNSFQ